MPAIQITTKQLVAGVLAATAEGRALLATGFFDASEVSDAFAANAFDSINVGSKFAAGSIPTDKLIDVFIKANGTQAFTADQPMGGFKITGLGAPIAATDAARKQDVDAVAAGLSWKDAVRVATAAALPAATYANGTSGVGATLTATTAGVLTVDGVATVLGDRILVKNQASGLENGIYEVTTEGTATVAFVLTRVTDADVSAELDSAAVFVQVGTANADRGYTQTTSAPIIGTDALVWTQFTPTIAASTPRQEPVTTQNITGTDTALTDLLDFTPVSNAAVSLYLNGLHQQQGAGKDYTISGKTITWLAGTGTAVDMATTDVLVAVYASSD